MLIMGCVLSFLLGAAMAAGGMYHFMDRQRRRFEAAAQLFSKPAAPKTAAANQYVTLPGLRRGAPGVQELADMKTSYRRPPGSPTKTVLSTPILGSAATIRRSGGNRYDPVSTQELRVDLQSDTMY